jgi:hypothetical protein
MKMFRDLLSQQDINFAIKDTLRYVKPAVEALTKLKKKSKKTEIQHAVAYKKPK